MIKPIADRVLLKVEEAKKVTENGLFIPDSAVEKPMRAKVIATGNGIKDSKIVVSVGDTVIYSKQCGTPIVLDGEEYLMVREADIYAIL